MVAKAQDVGTRGKDGVSVQPRRDTPRRLPYRDYFRVEDARQSECAYVIFVYDTANRQRFVLKALKEYQDETRYSLGKREERHKCLIEALRVNRIFSSPFAGIYKGLVRLVQPDHFDGHLDIHRDLIITGEILKNPRLDELDKESEYALIMTRLPEEKQLDYLLFDVRGNTSLLKYYGQLLVDRVVFMHKNSRFDLPLDLAEHGIEWGSLTQLRNKLKGNLQFLKEALNKSKNGLYRDYNDWLEEQIKKLSKWLEAAYEPLFADRVRKGYIKHCHGDLKTPNIWIAPHYSQESNEVRDAVFLLDAIDFNAYFGNIDILSDFAMLVVDIHVRTGSQLLTDFMIEQYLSRTGQQDERIKVVLYYYMLEKAIVGAAVSVIDEDLKNQSREFLKVAKIYADRLDDQVKQLSPQTVAGVA